MSHIILLGKPGSGKGTIASQLISQYGYTVLSGSDILRENSQDPSAPYYKEAKYSLDHGVLIDSDILNAMVTEKVKSLNGKKVVFDGFPRTIEQVEHIFSLYDTSSLMAFYIDVNDEIIKSRILDRIVCEDCASSFSSKEDSPKHPKVAGICDHCNGTLIKRKDDNEETLVTRLAQYEEKTQPIFDILKNNIEFHVFSNEDVKAEDVIEKIKK